MTQYETIFKRRSVRQYEMTALEDNELAEIQTLIDTIEQISGQQTRLEIVTADKVKNDIAPYYVLARCTADTLAYINAGYVLQSVDLYLQSNGYGSLWLGTAKPNESDDDFCIMLAFGKTNVPLRSGVQEFKRLSIDEISNSDNVIAQAARLAPSAMNSQPWKLDFSDGKVTIRYYGRGVSKLILKHKLSKIDLGIVTKHIETALLFEGKYIREITPKTNGKGFEIDVIYQ